MTYICNILLGRITKAIGYEGAVSVKLERSFIENIPQIESVFIEIDGRPVPFFISESDYSGSDILKLKFNDYNTEAKVTGFRGCRVYITSGDSYNDHADDFNELKGYEVMNEGDLSLGKVTEIIKNPGQLLLKIITLHKKEILIPLHEDLIINLDNKGKIIVMNIPDGLTEIN
ncbi:MAG TPA: ribosome maturation factor RimM [Bacteroidales bacterium]|nr:ribosome maturation factor RimM [Bacteroidales bacterium]